jgi:adenylyl-sulfate kinase
MKVMSQPKSLVITPLMREKRHFHPGCVVWLTGLSGAGKSTIATALEHRLFTLGMHTYVLDGDQMRQGLCRDLGYSVTDRIENIRRVGEVAALFADAGLIVIVAFISPFRAGREAARRRLSQDRFLEVFVNAPLEVCEQRDVKGLYAKARANLILEFTGVSSPYEQPLNPDLELRTHEQSVEVCVTKLTEALEGLPPTA